MFNIGGGELLVIMLLALIILGPQRLPTAARTVGRVMGDLRRISSGFQQELKDALDDGDSPTPLRRKESVPLASTVAAVDKGDKADKDDDGAADEADTKAATPAPDEAGTRDDTSGPQLPGGGDDTSRSDAVRTGDDAGDDTAGDTTVAPAVAAAIGEIVTPIEPSATTPPAAPADAPEGPGDDAVGDERAAS